MKTRKQFLSILGRVSLIPMLSPLGVFAASCGQSARTFRTESSNGKVVIPAASIPGVRDSESYSIYIDGSVSPLYVYRRPDGELMAVSSICTHKGCTVKKVRGGFECPCHGSEYDAGGAVRRGPAPHRLERFAVEVFGEDVVIDLARNR